MIKSIKAYQTNKHLTSKCSTDENRNKQPKQSTARKRTTTNKMANMLNPNKKNTTNPEHQPTKPTWIHKHEHTNMNTHKQMDTTNEKNERIHIDDRQTWIHKHNHNHKQMDTTNEKNKRKHTDDHQLPQENAWMLAVSTGSSESVQAWESKLHTWK